MDDMIYTSYVKLFNQERMEDAINNKRHLWNNYAFTTHPADKYNILDISKEIQVPIPRVTEILDACIGKSYLQNWAASLGDNYVEERQKILNTGTLAHNMVEDFLRYGYIRDNTLNYDKPCYNEQSTKCYYNFITWWNNMIEQGFKIDIIDIEKTIVCPLYGGTADIIAHIKDPTGLEGNYILDFKTSKSISIDYFYQTIMYKLAIEYENVTSDEPLPIDGVGIIRCDKFKNTYEYLIINKMKDPEFINSLEIAVNNMINWYYNQINSGYQYKIIRNKYMKGDKWV
jgi:hypothetical protein